MKDETAGVWIKELVGLKPKMYSYLVDEKSEHKKGKCINKDVLMNNKCLRHLMNRIQSKNDSIRTYEINKISLYCFDDKIYIQNNGCVELALGY